MTYLVIGARGSIGGAVLRALMASAARVRASSRSPRLGEFPPGVDVVRADLTDPSTFPRLLAGVEKVFLGAEPTTIAVFVEPIIASVGSVPQGPVDLRVDSVQEVVGRPPVSFATWAHEDRDDLR
ncbi:hypothetical protein DEI92_15640 [Curtobacterium sp. MCBD17_034]|uniref:SDR family oxidoreductase n=1 Tax=unclassified Curtobacterium TaxID=257496 RepID=UPI000DA79745|nr:MULTISPECIES: NAD(P)H-binding protein [unclassified Curtobacterium]PZF56060.1 hypothetical protein DEI92_15640 [Curtobacterium sp. MCBD17_034]PZM32928.1 hypothetical protein DEI90_15505 [Curtobacterium sp. MCBD17_031]